MVFPPPLTLNLPKPGSAPFPWAGFQVPCHKLTISTFSFSPGRTTGTFDNEIIMMNHVYRERFPKVGWTGPNALPHCCSYLCDRQALSVVLAVTPY